MFIAGFVCSRPLLENKQKFPDSSFIASASSKGHSASDGRISSGSSWCAPVSNDKHYLQVDFGRLYVIYNFVIFGDSTSSKWVTAYNLNYTVDLINWRAIWSKEVIAKYYLNGIRYRNLLFIKWAERCNIKDLKRSLFVDKMHFLPFLQQVNTLSNDLNSTIRTG